MCIQSIKTLKLLLAIPILSSNNEPSTGKSRTRRSRLLKTIATTSGSPPCINGNSTRVWWFQSTWLLILSKQLTKSQTCSKTDETKCYLKWRTTVWIYSQMARFHPWQYRAMVACRNSALEFDAEFGLYELDFRSFLFWSQNMSQQKRAVCSPRTIKPKEQSMLRKE